ncbi:hypothetical protein CFR73_06660 [Novacetimonas maltaceti]|nr:hypothetical protein CFR73_06660 [Novacetimonas maltaceti]
MMKQSGQNKFRATQEERPPALHASWGKGVHKERWPEIPAIMTDPVKGPFRAGMRDGPAGLMYESFW